MALKSEQHGVAEGAVSKPVRLKWKAPAVRSVAAVMPSGLLCVTGQCLCDLDLGCYANPGDCFSGGGTSCT